jgi:putative NIF3 family GTP cyclohydrolase 1 type 2
MQQVFAALDLTNVMLAGKPPEVVRTVALCGGSGSDLAEEAFSQDADVYLSAEIKHSTARWAEEVGFCVIDGTHYATERPAIALLEKQIVAQALAADWDLQVLQSESEMPVFNSFQKDDFK